MMRGATSAAALLVVLAAALPARAGNGAPERLSAPPSLYGVVSQAPLSQQDIERMDEGNVGTVRVTLAWADIDPTPVPGSYDWAKFDAVVAAAARHGITVLPTAFSVPSWVSALEGCAKPASGPCTITPPQTTLGLRAWSDFLGAATRRYGPGGLFWLLHPELPARPIRTWQIWNEENSPGFYQPRPDVAGYASLLATASEAIRGQDPGAEVVLGGMFRYPLGGRDGGLRATEFLRGLYAIPGIRDAFDGVAVHPYAGRMTGVKVQVKRIRRVIAAAGDSDAGLWISEIGWASGGRANPLNRGPAGQARRLRQAFAYFARARKRLGIRAVLWFAWRDVSEVDSRCKWCARSGLFPTRGFSAKPAWNAFLGFTGGR